LSTRQLLAFNPQVVPERLRIGTNLRLGNENPNNSGAHPSSFASSRDSYIVKRGDTLSEIAQNLGVSTASLKASNPAVDPRRMLVGKELQVPSRQNASEGQNARSRHDKRKDKPAERSRERNEASPRAPTYNRN